MTFNPVDKPKFPDKYIKNNWTKINTIAQITGLTA